MTADDWVKIIGAIAGALVLVIGALGTLYVKIEQVHQVVNRNMLELLQMKRNGRGAAETTVTPPAKPLGEPHPPE